MEKNRNLGGLDYFRLFAAFLVVAIHTYPLSSFNSEVDFVFTRILARMAVPFFLMVSGYFLLPQYLFEHARDYQPFFSFLKKTLILYLTAIVIYLPANIYAGHFQEINLLDIFRIILFDGTFYHLWYLPASMLGILLIIMMSRKLPLGILTGFTVALYGIGLLGDSYYGLTAYRPPVRAAYDLVFQLSSYSRNGLFYAPVFLLIGAWLKVKHSNTTNASLLMGFLISATFMVIEGLALHHLNVQRHDSMYLTLPLCMHFLFQLLLSVKSQPAKRLRTISTWIYLIHPLCIIFVRGLAKFSNLEDLLIKNSLVHYMAVCLLSYMFAAGIQKISERTPKQSFCKDRAWIELDMEHLHQNVSAIKDLLPPGCQLMPAVKANAYGHGAILISKELNKAGIKSFCVATVSEGMELRRNGIRGEILILGYTHPEQFPLLRRFRLTQTVIDHSYAQLLNAYGKKLKVHLKIDTGMHRLGERSERIKEICEMFKLKNLVIEGAFTHLCADETKSESDRNYTIRQADAFYHTIQELKMQGCDCGKVHLLASYGLLNYPELAGDYARIGIALYGVLSNRADLEGCPVRLNPVLSVKTRISLTKNLYAGESAGYGLAYTAQSNRKIAVLPIGYADGIPRALSCGNGKVLINGNEAPIIGRICMDQMLVDVTDIPDIRADDIAVIIGKSGNLEITAYNLAEKDGTITNELLSRLGSRLSRITV